MDILEAIKCAVAIERDGLEQLLKKVDENAVQAAKLLHACKGRVIVTGMGKTGLVGKKIAATLSSTGTPAFFLHPAEAFHGDLGIVVPGDVVLAVSNSGETDEVVRLLPHFKRFRIPVISLTGNPRSMLARYSDIVLDVSVDQEACPLGYAPTASTTVTMAMGDALAAALVRLRSFTKEQFAIFHPGGSLGKKLLWHVSDLMHTGGKVPLVEEHVALREAICEMTSKGLGAAFVHNGAGALTGILTDGDLRRILQKQDNPLAMPVLELMIRSPKKIHETALAAEALNLMEENAITVLPVVDEADRPYGAIHLHDLVRAGLA